MKHRITKQISTSPKDSVDSYPICQYLHNVCKMLLCFPKTVMTMLIIQGSVSVYAINGLCNE